MDEVTSEARETVSKQGSNSSLPISVVGQEPPFSSRWGSETVTIRRTGLAGNSGRK